jgi:hypothetical protein
MGLNVEFNPSFLGAAVSYACREIFFRFFTSRMLECFSRKRKAGQLPGCLQ